MTNDVPEGIEAALRRALLERDQARATNDELKRQNKTLRQQLRRERAEHLATHKRLEALRAELFGSNMPKD